MDLIYTDTNGVDVQILHGYQLDEEYGEEKNDFELTLDADRYVDLLGCRVYCYGTEYGGLVDDLKANSGSGEAVFHGRTWHGVLEKKILCPDDGEAYLTVSGDVNTVLASLISRMGLEDLFEAPEEEAGVTITYRFSRYTDAYSGLRAMLQEVERKLLFRYGDSKVSIWTEPITDYSQDEEWDSSQVVVEVAKAKRRLNHLICLGSGQLAERTVIHLYADEEGNISTTQTLFGADEIAEKYDYANVESAEELEAQGRKELRERMVKSGASSTDMDTEQIYDIDDVVGAREHITNTSVTRRIVRKIVKISDGAVTTEYKIGE